MPRRLDLLPEDALDGRHVESLVQRCLELEEDPARAEQRRLAAYITPQLLRDRAPCTPSSVSSSRARTVSELVPSSAGDERSAHLGRASEQELARGNSDEPQREESTDSA